MTTPTMLLRNYVDSDLEAVTRVFTASVHILAAAWYDDAQRAAWAPTQPDTADWQARLTRLKTVVAEVDSELAGFISWEPHGHIQYLYTAPQFARRGVASALLACMEAEFSASAELSPPTCLQLTTEASLVARPFFEAKGFTVVEEQIVQRRGVSFRRFAMSRILR